MVYLAKGVLYTDNGFLGSVEELEATSYGVYLVADGGRELAADSLVGGGGVRGGGEEGDGGYERGGCHRDNVMCCM